MPERPSPPTATSGSTPATRSGSTPERNLTFVDRFDDRIRRRGENVASADVEGVLAAHPAVAEAAVVAVPADEEGGEDEIKAVVVAAAGAVLDAESVWAWCDERLPYFAVPRYVELAPELPKTPTSKVRKNELRAAGVGTRPPTAAGRRAAGTAVRIGVVGAGAIGATYAWFLARAGTRWRCSTSVPAMSRRSPAAGWSPSSPTPPQSRPRSRRRPIRPASLPPRWPSWRRRRLRPRRPPAAPGR